MPQYVDVESVWLDVDDGNFMLQKCIFFFESPMQMSLFFGKEFRRYDFSID